MSRNTGAAVGREASGWQRILPLALIVLIVIASAVIKVWNLGAHAFSFDESIYVTLGKRFVAEGFSWDVERQIGSAHPPLQIFLGGWLWKWFTAWGISMPEEVIFRLPTVIMGSITILLIYATVKRYTTVGALVASATFAFHPYPLWHSRINEMDIPLLFWLTASMFFCLGYPLKTGRARWFYMVMSGVTLGMAGVTKLYGLAAALPVLAFAFGRILAKETRFFSAVKDVLVIGVSSLLAVVAMSWLLTGNPAILYEAFRANQETLYFSVPGWAGGKGFNVLGFLAAAPSRLYGILQTLARGWGIALLAVALLGISAMFAKRTTRAAAWYLAATAVTTMIVFVPFYWLRYLLMAGAAITAAYGYGISEIVSDTRDLIRSRVVTATGAFAGILVLLLLSGSVYSLVPYRQLGKLYSARISGDVLWGDTLRQGALFIKERFQPGEWVLTNTQFPVMVYYGGFPAAYFQHISPPDFVVYRIYDEKAKNPAVVPITWEEENRMRFIVVDDTPLFLSGDKVLLDKQVNHSFSRVTPQLQSYIDELFTKVAEFGPNGEMRIYERSSRNFYLAGPLPEIWVGESGAFWKDKLGNYNGWISREGWGTPARVVVGGETYWVRTAFGSTENYANFVLPVGDVSRPYTLEVVFRDVGVGRAAVSTLLAETRQGRLEKFSRPLAEIQLTNSGVVKTATFSSPEIWNYDVSPDIDGHQQQFSFSTKGSPIQVIKVALKQ
ncbi:MAG: phospholipid carrier-dependent glycosyltransferase [Chloroflexi bacterium]|nr:phospholipid carrier-dependent glycosyltransferase [Chloroflexota bacterium]